mmetsp:Transcript_27856/g.86450  ORF Transcript_27856/g.86450 Transcript_27856/m.86450 type:complete len:267 (-) Transcript_27856:278-1078(-)
MRLHHTSNSRGGAPRLSYAFLRTVASAQTSAAPTLWRPNASQSRRRRSGARYASSTRPSCARKKPSESLPGSCGSSDVESSKFHSFQSPPFVTKMEHGATWPWHLPEEWRNANAFRTQCAPHASVRGSADAPYSSSHASNGRTSSVASATSPSASPPLSTASRHASTCGWRRDFESLTQRTAAWTFVEPSSPFCLVKRKAVAPVPSLFWVAAHCVHAADARPPSEPALSNTTSFTSCVVRLEPPPPVRREKMFMIAGRRRISFGGD